MTISIQAQMNSPNGGIPMWIPRLADFIAENGVEHCIRGASEDEKYSQDNIKKKHLQFLISGLQGINPDEFAAAVEPLKQYPKKLRELEARWSGFSKKLDSLRADWTLAAGDVKMHILAWQKWASLIEAAARKEAFPWVDADWLDFSTRHELSGATLALSSPQDFIHNIDFFNEKVAAIREVIERSYVNGLFNDALNPLELDKAIRLLLDKQSELLEYEVSVNEAKKMWDSWSESYRNQRQSLVQLLWLMPKSAHVALFWLCRPEIKYQS